MYNEYEEDEEVESSGNKNFLAEFYNNNKTLVWILLGIIVLFIILSIVFGGGGSSGSSSQLVITNDGKEVTEINLTNGNSVKLSAKIGSKSGSYTKWSSSNNEVASVDDTGLVRGLRVGSVTVTATVDVNSSPQSATCVIHITNGDPSVHLSSVKLPEGDLLMGIGADYSLSVVSTPPNGYIGDVKYSSNNPSVATVDESGRVKGVSKGQARISISVNNGQFTDDIMVSVNDNMSGAKLTTGVQSIKFQNAIEKILVGKVTQLKFETDPLNADLSSIVWKSSNDSVVKVDEKTGALTGVKVGGTALIKAYSLSGSELGVITVEVVDSLNEVTSITVPNPTITMSPGSSQQLVPTVKPDNASNKGLTYTSSNPSVVSVTSVNNGISATINANSTGTAVITITSSNGVTASLTVNVTTSGSGSNGGGGGYTPDEHDDKGYNISSKDKNNKGIIVRNYSSTSESRNIGDGPLTVTFKITSNSTSSLKVCFYKKGSSSCNPDTDSTGVTTINKGSSNDSIRIDEEGVWVIVVSEYDGTKRKTKLEWYARLDSASGGSTADSGTGSGTGSGGGTGTGSSSTYVTCCYKNSSNKFEYGRVLESKCYSKTLSQNDCLAKNNSGGSGTGTPPVADDDKNVNCCYKSGNSWTYKEMKSSTCSSYSESVEGLSSSECSAKNNQPSGGSGGSQSISLNASYDHVYTIFGDDTNVVDLKLSSTGSSFSTIFLCVGPCSTTSYNEFVRQAKTLGTYFNPSVMSNCYDPAFEGTGKWYMISGTLSTSKKVRVKLLGGQSIYVAVSDGGQSNPPNILYSNTEKVTRN